MDAVGVEGGEGGTEEEEAASALDDVEYAAAAVSQLRLLGLNIGEGCTRASRPACRAAPPTISTMCSIFFFKFEVNIAHKPDKECY